MNGVVAVSAAAAILSLIVSAVRRAEPGVGGVLSAVLTLWILSVVAYCAVYFINGLSADLPDEINIYAPYVLKCAGIGFLTQTAADICTDAGERAVGGKILTAGKMGMLTVCLPLIRSILGTALGYING